MVESYKVKSKVATAISFIAALIAYLGKDGLTAIMPVEYANLVPVLVFAAGYVLAQKTEDKRVDVAEQLAVENFVSVDPSEPVLNDEYTTGDLDE